MGAIHKLVKSLEFLWIFEKLFEGEMFIGTQTTTLQLLFCDLTMNSYVSFKSVINRDVFQLDRHVWIIWIP